MIHLLWCTIRPKALIGTYRYWLNMAENTENFKLYVCVNTNEDAEIIRQDFPSVDITISDNPTRYGVTYPSYLLSSKLIGEPNDIVVFASDDFTPPEKWDTYLINKLKDKNGALIVRDGYQLPDFSNMLHPCITIPIMTFSCLEKLNKIIYNPNYFHLFSDSELYLNLKDLDLIIDDRVNDSTTFEHHHHSSGKRPADSCDQVYYVKWKEDEDTWNKRKNLSVEERLVYEKEDQN